MNTYLKTATKLELLEDIIGAAILFGMVFFGPYFVAILVALFG